MSYPHIIQLEEHYKDPIYDLDFSDEEFLGIMENDLFADTKLSPKIDNSTGGLNPLKLIEHNWKAFKVKEFVGSFYHDLFFFFNDKDNSKITVEWEKLMMERRLVSVVPDYPHTFLGVFLINNSMNDSIEYPNFRERIIERMDMVPRVCSFSKIDKDTFTLTVSCPFSRTVIVEKGIAKDKYVFMQVCGEKATFLHEIKNAIKQEDRKPREVKPKVNQRNMSFVEFLEWEEMEKSRQSRPKKLAPNKHKFGSFYKYDKKI